MFCVSAFTSSCGIGTTEYTFASALYFSLSSLKISARHYAAVPSPTTVGNKTFFEALCCISAASSIARLYSLDS